MEFCTFFEPARRGRICRNAIRRIKPVTGAFNSGSSLASCVAFWKRSPKTFGCEADSTCEKRLSTGLFLPQKGGPGVGKTKRGKGTKLMAVADGHGLPVAICVESASPHEVTLVHKTLAEIFVREPLQRLIGDNAYDSDPLDSELAQTGVEMIAPHRSTRINRTQDGRPPPTLSPPLENRAVLCLASKLSPDPNSMGIPSP